MHFISSFISVYVWLLKRFDTNENNTCYLYSHYDCGNEVLRAVTLLLRLQVGVMAWSLLLWPQDMQHFSLFYFYLRMYKFIKFGFSWTNHNVGCAELVFAVSR